MPTKTETQVRINDDDIRNAFVEDQFELFYQPQLSLADEQSKLVNVECLIRLNHPVLGLLMPEEFLAAVVRSKKITDLTYWVVTRACEDWQRWSQLDCDISISVNITQEVLLSNGMCQQLESILAEYNVPKNRLMLELCVANDETFDERVYKVLTHLRLIGFSLSFDHYRENLVSENLFLSLPLNEVKIDRSLVSGAQRDEKSKSVARKIIHHCRNHGIHTVAVGVESKEQAEWLLQQGCDSAQGFYFSKPMPSSAFQKEILNISNSWKKHKSQQRLSLLIVEDDVQYAELLTDALSEIYDVKIANNLYEANVICAESMPPLVILDVKLPDGSGIDLCRTILADNGENSSSVLFVSGHNNPKDRILAYEAGGVDFLSKPFSLSELIVRLGRVANYQQKRGSVPLDLTDMQEAAMISMKEAAHYGDIVHFFKNLMHCYDEQALAKELFRYMKHKSLNCSIQFHSADDTYSLDLVNGLCSPIENNVFELLKGQGRLYEFGQRLIVNDTHLSFLIKNMPAEEEERGRIRDYAAVMIEGLETRYRDLLRQRIIRSVLQQLEQLASILMESILNDQKFKTDTIEKMSMDLNMSFHVLDLTEEQEKHLADIIEKIVLARETQSISTNEISVQIEEIAALLNEALEGLEGKHENTDFKAASGEIELF